VAHFESSSVWQNRTHPCYECGGKSFWFSSSIDWTSCQYTSWHLLFLYQAPYQGSSQIAFPEHSWLLPHFLRHLLSRWNICTMTKLRITYTMWPPGLQQSMADKISSLCRWADIQTSLIVFHIRSSHLTYFRFNWRISWDYPQSAAWRVKQYSIKLSHYLGKFLAIVITHDSIGNPHSL